MGRVGLPHTLTSNGGVESEFSVAMLEGSHAYLVCAAAAEVIDFDRLQQHAKAYDVTVTNVSGEFAVIVLMGPRSRDVLSQLTNSNLNSDFEWLHAKCIDVNGIAAGALRVSYIGELGWELHVPKKHATSLFQSLEAAGQAFNIGYFGAYATNSMRLEKGYRAWGPT